MSARKHLTRHDMKQDELVSGLALATQWIEANARQVMMGAGALVVGILLILAGYFWYDAREERAAVMLGEVQRVAALPLEGEPGATDESAATAEERAGQVVEAADEMLATYGSGTAAAWARYTRAGALLELGRVEEAAADAGAASDAAGSGTLLQAFATMMEGRAEEARGNLQRAVELYEEAASFDAGDFPAELALMDQARCQQELGEIQAATSTYQKIMDLYQDSPLASEASIRLQDLRDAGSGT